MPTENKRGMPEDIRRIYRLGEALGAVPEAGRAALREVLKEHFDGSHEFATDPETHPDKRPFWCGANHQVTCLRDDIEDLLTGAWRNWEQIKQWREDGGEDED
jgi:hypothetical protein